MAHAYSNIYKTPITCLRIFTAFGIYGRPDMALFQFTKTSLKEIKLQFLIKETTKEISLMLIL